MERVTQSIKVLTRDMGLCETRQGSASQNCLPGQAGTEQSIRMFLLLPNGPCCTDQLCDQVSHASCIPWVISHLCKVAICKLSRFSDLFSPFPAAKTNSWRSKMISTGSTKKSRFLRMPGVFPHLQRMTAALSASAITGESDVAVLAGWMIVFNIRSHFLWKYCDYGWAWSHSSSIIMWAARYKHNQAVPWLPPTPDQVHGGCLHADGEVQVVLWWTKKFLLKYNDSCLFPVFRKMNASILCFSPIHSFQNIGNCRHLFGYESIIAWPSWDMLTGK